MTRTRERVEALLRERPGQHLCNRCLARLLHARLRDVDVAVLPLGHAPGFKWLGGWTCDGCGQVTGVLRSERAR